MHLLYALQRFCELLEASAGERAEALNDRGRVLERRLVSPAGEQQIAHISEIVKEVRDICRRHDAACEVEIESRRVKMETEKRRIR